MSEENEIIQPDIHLLPFHSDARRFLFGNIFHGRAIPNTSTVFFGEEEEEERLEIKGSDVTVRGSDQPWQIVYGDCRIGGVITFITTDVPGGGEWIHLVTTIAGHRIKAVDGLYLDGSLVDHNTSGDHIHGWSVNDWGFDPPTINSYVFTSVSDGDANQVANADLVSQSAALFPGIWTSDHRQRGRAHVYNIFYFDPEKFPNGFPEIKFQVRGKDDIYDPRSGGSTGYTNNAALVIADYIKNADFGLNGDYTNKIDEDALEAAADICDENVTLSDLTTEKRYTINGVFDSSEDPFVVLRKMQTAIGGAIEYSNGKWRIVPASWEAPTVSLGEDDIVGSVQITTQQSRRNLFNGVKGTYLSAEEGYEIADFPAVTNGTYETEDGEQILKDVTYPLTTSGATVQRLSKIMLEKARQAITVETTFTLKAFELRIAENVKLSISKYGWTDKHFQVKMWEPVISGETVAIKMRLQETAEAVYDWADGEETTTDLAANTTLPEPTFVATPANLTLNSGTAQLYKREDGTIFSRVKVGWDAVTDPFVKNGGTIEIRVKNDTQGDSYQTVAVIPGDQTFYHILDVKDGDQYSIGIRNVNALGVKSDWVTDQETIKGKQEPPSVVSSITGTPNELGIDLAWNQVADKDISHYFLGYGDDRANDLKYSEDMSNAEWEKTRSSITSNDAVAPDGNTTADKLVEDSTASNNHLLRQDGLAVTNTEKYRVQVFLKKDERKYARVTTHGNGFASNIGAIFDLDAGTVHSNVNSSESPAIESVGNGWYKCSFLATSDETHANAKIQIELCDDNADHNYDGDGSSGLHVWGFTFQDDEENGIYVKTTSAAIASGTLTEIAKVDSDSYTWKIQSAATYEVKIYAVDTTGNIAITYTSVSVTVSAPSVPQTLASTISGPDTLLTWAAPATTQFTVEEYQIKQGATVIARVKGTSFQKKVTWSGTQTFKVAAVDVAGNTGSEATVDVTITAPSVVTAINTKVVDNNVLFAFTKPSTHTLPIDYYILKKGSTYAGATEVAQSSRAHITLFETTGGAFTYWIVAVDTAGNEGTEQSKPVTVNPPPDFVLHADADIDPEDADTRTNIIDTEDLSEDAIYAPVVTGETWTQHFTNNSNNTFQDFIDDGYTVYLEPANTSAAVIEEKIDLGVELASSIISTSIQETSLVGSGMTVTAEISWSDDDVSYTSGGSGVDSVLANNFRYIKTKYTITAPNDKTLSKFKDWHYNVQVKTQTDGGRVEVTSNPTNVTFDKDFIDVQSITVTYDGSTGLIAVASYDYSSAPADDNFDIRLFDTDNADASGSGKYVTWIAKGTIAAPS